MTRTGMSRRKAIETGAFALVGAAGLLVAADAHATERGATGEEIIRKWYKSWEKADVDQFRALMAENFTFTSPVPADDHISASVFKTRCWDSQTGYIERFDLEKVIASGSDVFVRYLCHTKNGKSFRNVEYFRLRDGKVEALECYFGGISTFPSAVSKT